MRSFITPEISKRYTSSDGAVTGVRFTSFYISADAVFSSLAGLDNTGSAVNFVSTLNISGQTLNKGDLYVTDRVGGIDFVITSFQITSGTVIFYR